MTLDSEDDNAFWVHISAGHVITFIRGPLPCLYYFDVVNIHMYKLKLVFSFLNTVSENKKIFNNREVQKATNAFIINRTTNHIAKETLVWIVLDPK